MARILSRCFVLALAAATPLSAVAASFDILETNGVFINPTGGTDNDGLGTSVFLSGDDINGGGSRTRLSYVSAGNQTQIAPGQEFTIGYLNIFNGISLAGSTANGVTLAFNARVFDFFKDVQFFTADTRRVSIINNVGLAPESYAVDEFPHAAVVEEEASVSFPIIAVIEQRPNLPEAFTASDSLFAAGSAELVSDFQLRLVDFGEPIGEGGSLIDNPVPEPSTAILAAFTSLGLLVRRRR